MPAAQPMVYDELRSLIVQARLAPGTRLVEQEVAARLGVSRTPVRAALARLQQEGLLAPTPTGSGTSVRAVVAPLTHDDGEEVFHLMGALEGVAGRHTAALERDVRLRLADEMKMLSNEFRRAAERRKSEQHRTAVDADAEFHRRLVEAAGPRLRALHALMHPQAERYERAYLSVLVDVADEVEDDHLAIIRGIRDGDGAETQRAAQAHWRNAADRLKWAMQAGGERGAW